MVTVPRVLSVIVIPIAIAIGMTVQNPLAWMLLCLGFFVILLPLVLSRLVLCCVNRCKPSKVSKNGNKNEQKSPQPPEEKKHCPCSIARRSRCLAPFACLFFASISVAFLVGLLGFIVITHPMYVIT